MKQKIKVVFIAGYGRSGSTLLDRVLGHALGACSTGELRHIWERGYKENQLCGCGEKFHSCTFWQTILADWKDLSSINDIDSIISLKNQVDRMRKVPALLFSSLQSPKYKKSYLLYSQALMSLYQTIQHHSHSETIIDSSKDPSYLYLLFAMSRDRLIDLHVVHLVRDSRAAAYSWLRSKKRPEIYWREEKMPVYSIPKSAAEWLVFNAIISISKFFLKNRYFFLRYEDFALCPRQTLQRIFAFLRDTESVNSEFVEKEFQLPIAHTVSGNPMRFENGKISIRLDSEWTQKLPLSQKWFVNIITLPLLAAYGYQL